MKRQSFDKDNYELNFGSIFTHDTIKTAFKKFLKTEFNEEPLLFILEVEELEKIKNDEKKGQVFIKILKKYIFEGAERQINISFDKKKDLLELYEQQKNSESWILKLTPAETFENVIKNLKQELNYDPFKRFVRTKECEKLMIQHHKENTVVVPKIFKSFDYKLEDFVTPDIVDTDFQFALSLLKDDYSWKVSHLVIYLTEIS